MSQLTQQKAKDTLKQLHDSAKIEIVDPVYLLLKFEGSATSGASGP